MFVRVNKNYECNLGKDVIKIIYQGNHIKMTGRCFLDYKETDGDYCTLYVNYDNIPLVPVNTMIDFENHPMFYYMFDIHKGALGEEDIVNELNEAMSKQV